MLRILANENLPGPVVRTLRQAGHDVRWVKESMRGARDGDVLQRAHQEGRILVTFERDFGELAFRHSLPAGCGIVLFRLTGSDPATDNARAVEAITSREDWGGHFSVIHDDRIRMRALQGDA